MKRTEAIPYPQRSSAGVGGLDHRRVGRQAEVIVRAEVQDLPPGGDRMRAPCGLPMTRSSLKVPAPRISSTAAESPGALSRQASWLSSAISRTTFPQLPDCIASKPLRNSVQRESMGENWGDVQPALEHGLHLVPCLEDLPCRRSP